MFRMPDNTGPKTVKLSFYSGVDEIMGMKSMSITVDGSIRKMSQLIPYLYNEVFKDNERKDELFLDEDTVKPGILVLHNNIDINLFEQAEEDAASGDDTESEDEATKFRNAMNIVIPGSLPGPEEIEKPPKLEVQKLRINTGDEITFMSIIHGG